MIIQNNKQDCLDSEALKGLGFTNTNNDPEIQDQDICQEQIKKYGSCVNIDELKQLIKQQQDELIDNLELDQEIDDVLNSYQGGLEGTNLEDEFNQTRQNYKENKSKCGNKLAKVNQGVLCLIASGQASQYTQINGTEITVDVNSKELEDSNQSCEPVVEAICLAGAGQSIENDIVVDDSEIIDDNQELQDTCSDIKKDKNNLIEKFNTQKIKKVIPKKEKIKKIKEKVDIKQQDIKEKIKDKKDGENIAKQKNDTKQNDDDFEKEIQEQEKQKDGTVPQSDKQEYDNKQKPSQNIDNNKSTDNQNKQQQKNQDQTSQDNQMKPQQQDKSQQDTQQQQSKNNTKKKYRRLQTTYNLNIKQTINGAPVVSISQTSGVDDAYNNNNILKIFIIYIILLFQINQKLFKNLIVNNEIIFNKFIYIYYELLICIDLI